MDNKRKLLSCHIMFQINKSTIYYATLYGTVAVGIKEVRRELVKK